MHRTDHLAGGVFDLSQRAALRRMIMLRRKLIGIGWGRIIALNAGRPKTFCRLHLPLRSQEDLI
ncbi:hypothetical protein RCCGEPOP_02411 [Rhizobium sp. Pop5]|nr:hypothetical protein RCCGEPOP_02411 [Rhizobium sp. Pop5]